MNREFLEFCMREAIAEAEKGRWTACPNPTVGAVLVRDGRIVARGYHHKAGMPHAEVECLRDAEAKGIDPKGCTIFVTLEPCNHTGRTGPCSEALVRAGVATCVIGMRDPNPVAKGGAERLREAGIEVIEGVCEQECRDLVADFVTWTVKKRPFVILKLASTLDGRIATRTGHSRWVTSEESRSTVHALRAGIGLAGGCVLVGGGTFRADNPMLTARLGEDCPQPRACVLTSRLPAAGDASHLIAERPAETTFYVSPALAASTTAESLRERGVHVTAVGKTVKGATDFHGLFRDLWEQGTRYVLCEGGGKLGLSLLEAGFVDIFLLHMSPTILGDNGAKPLFDGRMPLNMEEALRLRLEGVKLHGGDIHLTLRAPSDIDPA